MSAAGTTAARRAATALTATLGGESVTLRMPVPPVAGSDAEEIGLASPLFSDVVLSPVGLKLQGTRTVVLVAAEVLEAALGFDEAAAVESALQAASFVNIDSDAYVVEALERRSVHGRAYLYRFLLREPAATEKGAR